MIITFPSVTWPSHTTLVTVATAATHGVIGNAVFDRKAGRNLAYIGDPVLTNDAAIRFPTLYDAIHAKGSRPVPITAPSR